MIFLRSLIFNCIMITATIIFSLVSLFTYPFSFRKRYYFITSYSRFIMFFAKICCGIHYVVEGCENLPKEPAIILSNHQSTWEALAFQVIFPLQTWVVKKQLLKLPFFGWAFALLDPIAIDRNLPASAFAQILDQGKLRLKEGRWVVFFPEGTRRQQFSSNKFSRSGAYLAEKTETPVVPVAHNAGLFWPRHSFIKKPGTIRVVIGPVIDSQNKDSFAINNIAKQWISEQLDQINHG